MNFDQFRVPPQTSVLLKDQHTEHTKPFSDKAEAKHHLHKCRKQIADLQSKLFAQDTSGLLVVLQGIDASGKDSTIRHVLSGINPAGVRVKSFKVPSSEELDHDYLWRYVRPLPERGMIGVYNRSHYEEVLVVRVHPELLENERLHPTKKISAIWSKRFREINRFEEYLVENGFSVLKFFLNISKEEQKQRFLSRLTSPKKNWKFSEADVRERAYWDDYQNAFQEMLSETSTAHAPWYIVPADKKWFARAMVADLILSTLSSMAPEYPQLDKGGQEALKRGIALLEAEK